MPTRHRLRTTHARTLCPFPTTHVRYRAASGGRPATTLVRLLWRTAEAIINRSTSPRSSPWSSDRLDPRAVDYRARDDDGWRCLRGPRSPWLMTTARYRSSAAVTVTTFEKDRGAVAWRGAVFLHSSGNLVASTAAAARAPCSSPGPRTRFRGLMARVHETNYIYPYLIHVGLRGVLARQRRVLEGEVTGIGGQLSTDP